MARFSTGLAALWSHGQISTAHGFRRFAWANQLWAKICWLVVFVIGFIAFVVLIVFSIKHYETYAVKTIVKTEIANSAEFPSVTVCNLNPIRRSALTDVEERTLNSTVEAGSASDSTAVTKRIADQVRTISKPGNGHLLEKLILYCSYGGKICHPEKHFVPYQSSRYGQCYTFNSKDDPSAFSVQLGSVYGLTLILDAERFEHVPGVGESDGFRVSVHPKGTDPFPEIQGFSIPTEMEVLVGLRQKKTERLKDPYEKCDDQLPKDGFLKTTLSCGKECTTEDSCSTCYLPCREREYNMRFSLTKWPNNKHQNTLLDMLGTLHDKTFLENRIPDLAQLKVFYKDFAQTTVSQEPAYSWPRLLAQIGGISALCIGMSVLTLFESCDLAISAAIANKKDEDESQMIEN